MAKLAKLNQLSQMSQKSYSSQNLQEGYSSQDPINQQSPQQQNLFVEIEDYSQMQQLPHNDDIEQEDQENEENEVEMDEQDEDNDIQVEEDAFYGYQESTQQFEMQNIRPLENQYVRIQPIARRPHPPSFFAEYILPNFYRQGYTIADICQMNLYQFIGIQQKVPSNENDP